MKMRHGWLALLVSVSCGATVWGASVPATLSPDYMNTMTWLQKVVFGLDVEQVGRTIEPDGHDEAALDVIAYGVFLGYDVDPAITVFATAGGTDDQAVGGDESDSGGSSLKASVGANFNVGRYPIRQPAAMVGDRLNVKLIAELSTYNADTADWLEGSLALPIAYEVVEGDTYFGRTPEERLVLAIYIGPQISYLDGSVGTADREVDFTASQEFGLIAGLDFYMAPSASIGAHVDLYDTDADEVSGGASFRYHF